LIVAVGSELSAGFGDWSETPCCTKQQQKIIIYGDKIAIVVAK
jgi:hypothetical protein